MLLSCYVPSQIIPKSRIVHLADKQILKRHILSYPKIIVSKGRGGEGFDTWPMDYIQRATASAAHTRDPQRTTSSAVKPFQRPPISHNLQTPLVLPATTTEWRWVKQAMRTETRKQPTTKVTTLPATQTPEGIPNETCTCRKPGYVNAA